MKRKNNRTNIGIVLTVTVLLMTAIGVVSAAFEVADWSCSIPVEISGDNKYKAVMLDADVYENTENDLHDLRLIDAKGEAVPFYLIRSTDIFKKNDVIYNALLKRSVAEDDDTVNDYEVRENEKNVDIAGNKLVWALPKADFLKNIEVYGSYDGERWNFIVKDHIYRADGKEKNYISLGKTEKYKYYRAKILGNTERLEFKELKLVRGTSEVQTQRYEKTLSLKYESRNENRETLLSVYNPHKLRIVKLILVTGDDNFKRQYALFATDNQKNGREKKMLQRGEIYRFQFQGDNLVNNEIVTAVPLKEDNFMIKISNFDDRPLNIKEIQAVYVTDKLVFPDLGGAPYKLYVGNEKAEKPIYDIESQKGNIEKEAQDMCTLGEKQTIKKKYDTDEIKSIPVQYIFNGVIAAVALLLIVILLKKMKTKE